MPRIRVLLIVNRFNIGGPVFNAGFLARFLPEEFDVLLIGGVPDEGEKNALHVLDEYGVNYIVLEELQRNIKFSADKDAYRKLKAIVSEFKPDIVHTHASKAGFLGRRAAFKLGVKVVLHTFHGHVFHSYFGKLKTTLYKNIEKKLAKKSAGIIAISATQKQELGQIHSICPLEKIKVIPLGFDLDKFRENLAENRNITRVKYGLEENEVAIAIIGRLAPIKDHLFFLNVIEKALESEANLPIKVFIVGGGSELSIIEGKTNEINKKHGGKIILTSWILDIPLFVPGMDIVALTSKNEGTPMSLIEAQASNVAVISTDVGGVRDVMLDNETGFVIPQGNLGLFTEKLLTLIKNKEKREKMSQNGWIFVEEKFHYKTLVENTANYYKELLDKHR